MIREEEERGQEWDSTVLVLQCNALSGCWLLGRARCSRHVRPNNVQTILPGTRYEDPDNRDQTFENP
jgi:hypothetical protein